VCIKVVDKERVRPGPKKCIKGRRPLRACYTYYRLRDVPRRTPAFLAARQHGHTRPPLGWALNVARIGEIVRLAAAARTGRLHAPAPRRPPLERFEQRGSLAVRETRCAHWAVAGVGTHAALSESEPTTASRAPGANRTSARRRRRSWAIGARRVLQSATGREAAAMNASAGSIRCWCA